MAGLYVSFEPPRGWRESCEQRGDLFHTPAWAGVLERGFGARMLYVWWAEIELGFMISVFRIGPFAMGYPGFPVGGAMGGARLPVETITTLTDLRLPVPLHGLRFPARSLDGPPPPDTRRIRLLETTVDDLAGWQLSRYPKLRRDIARSRRMPIRLQDALPIQASHCYRLYRMTVSRHGGSPRYTERYFQALIKLAVVHPALEFEIAVVEDRLAGFMVTAHHGDAAYFLHGATDPEFQRLSPSDALIHGAIQRARDRELRRFEMLASPPEQHGLIRYKEKWGGTTRVDESLTVPIRENWLRLFEWSLVCHAGLKGLARAVSGGHG